LFITAAIIILAGISLYFLLREPTTSEYQQKFRDEPISDYAISSDGKMKKNITKNILIN